MLDQYEGFFSPVFFRWLLTFLFACGARVASPRVASPRVAAERSGAPRRLCALWARSQTCLLRRRRSDASPWKAESLERLPIATAPRLPTRWVPVPRTDPRMEPSDGELLLWRRFKNPARADGGSRAGLAAQIAAQFAPNAWTQFKTVPMSALELQISALISALTWKQINVKYVKAT